MGVSNFAMMQRSPTRSKGFYVKFKTVILEKLQGILLLTFEKLCRAWMTGFNDSKDIISGTHDINARGEKCKVLGVAKVRDGKVYEYHHIRPPK